MKGQTSKMKSEILDLQAALIKLGVDGIVTAKHIDSGRIAVYVDGEYFGIWDTGRKTFVD